MGSLQTLITHAITFLLSFRKSTKEEEVKIVTSYPDQEKAETESDYLSGYGNPDDEDWEEDEDDLYDDQDWEDNSDEDRLPPLGPDRDITYRVIEEFTNLFTSEENKYTEKVIWQGNNVDELSRTYPPSDKWGPDSADRLAHCEIEDGYLRWHFRFESLQKDGTWQKCEDPRNRKFVTGAFLEAEREADEYNRRMFPGDYMDVDDDLDDPYGDEDDEDYDSNYWSSYRDEE